MLCLRVYCRVVVIYLWVDVANSTEHRGMNGEFSVASNSSVPVELGELDTEVHGNLTWSSNPSFSCTVHRHHWEAAACVFCVNAQCGYVGKGPRKIMLLK
ncbi:hypothetical protein K435DRAFT_48594 [Dendrothele bispora CBS 962.96]|uniref:Secreted protein n=1 Tax=Dendrothele bispora (strain CBS 962.96) TaxID=1314807 RepID=A0A4V4HG90_DENBC|nr:hypothetical protein K435DRAFT_48594 [Dendrothele bispora CBS 962.96]